MSGFTREDVSFDSHGDRCAGWLYKPEGVENPPVVVLCHGLGAVREMALDKFSERFAQAGIAALSFTYRGFGDSEGEPRQLLDIDMQHADIRAALTYARGREDLDGTRVALWGSSFGGGHVMAVGARDRQLKAIVSQCPFTDGLASGLTVDPLSSLKISLRATMDAIGAATGGRKARVLLFGSAGQPALMTAPDALPGVERLIEGLNYPQWVWARVSWQITRYRPGKQLKNVQCPTLVCICDADTVAPAWAAKHYVGESPNADYRIYPCGHFDIYFDDAFERAVADQTAFLVKQLGVVQSEVAAAA
ncbi:MAG: alpha/beta fold hydrolase [Actinobacteria bacterium]|nr:alpha/beta fold hydrolase [Actinomycetota bacterium]